MTTVTEARRALAQIAERQAELQKIVDAAPKSLLTHDGNYTIGGAMIEDGFIAFETAKAYGDALDTLLMLRHQPGSEAVGLTNNLQWFVEVRFNKIETYGWPETNSKIVRISPCFGTKGDAQAAIDTIGGDRILRMFRTLHGVA
jgi:hypothetical protein